MKLSEELLGVFVLVKNDTLRNFRYLKIQKIVDVTEIFDHELWIQKLLERV